MRAVAIFFSLLFPMVSYSSTMDAGVSNVVTQRVTGAGDIATNVRVSFSDGYPSMTNGSGPSNAIHEDDLTLGGYIIIHMTTSGSTKTITPTYDSYTFYSNLGGPVTVTGAPTLTNTSESDISGHFSVLLCNRAGCGVAFDSAVTVPALKTCSASVSDVDLPSATPGTSTSGSLPVTITGTGAGSVTVSSTDLRTDGTLNLGGSTNVTIRPTAASYIDSMTGNWVVPGGDLSSIPLTTTVTTDATAQAYKSTMTATLSCE